jgi:hypothetical protein
MPFTSTPCNAQNDNASIGAGAACFKLDAKPRIQWYGWDSETEIWHGPNEVSPADGLSRRLLKALRSTAGRSWYGPVNWTKAGEAPCRLFALVHDLTDCAIAALYCNESKVGPAEVLAVVPAQRRAQLRPDFAFEFVAYARFLHTVDAGAELRVHEGIEGGIAEAREGDTLVFSMHSRTWPSDQEHVLSTCVEGVAAALEQWMVGAE